MQHCHDTAAAAYRFPAASARLFDISDAPIDRRILLILIEIIYADTRCDVGRRQAGGLSYF